jgi:hypothetical protein
VRPFCDVGVSGRADPAQKDRTCSHETATWSVLPALTPAHIRLLVFQGIVVGAVPADDLAGVVLRSDLRAIPHQRPSRLGVSGGQVC